MTEELIDLFCTQLINLYQFHLHDIIRIVRFCQGYIYKDIVCMRFKKNVIFDYLV